MWPSVSELGLWPLSQDGKINTESRTRSHRSCLSNISHHARPLYVATQNCFISMFLPCSTFLLRDGSLYSLCSIGLGFYASVRVVKNHVSATTLSMDSAFGVFDGCFSFTPQEGHRKSTKSRLQPFRASMTFGSINFTAETGDSGHLLGRSCPRHSSALIIKTSAECMAFQIFRSWQATRCTNDIFMDYCIVALSRPHVHDSGSSSS